MKRKFMSVKDFEIEEDDMLEEYDIENLNPRRNPYAERLRNRIAIDVDEDMVAYFKKQSEAVGIPYQKLMSLYLADCAAKKRKLEISWS